MRAFSEVLARTVQGEHRAANAVVYGTISDVSGDGRKVRVVVGADEEDTPVKGPWVPIGQWDGVMKMRLRPKAGQQVAMLCPAGDWEQAKALPFTWSDASPPPSEDPEEDVFQQGDTKVIFRSDRIELVAGGNSVLISTSGITLKAGGTEVSLTDALALIKSALIETDGETKLDRGGDQVMTASGPAQRVYARA